ncbi:MAG: hypothetical protein KDK51_05810 [Deltaproteobacteria bacterium]|nr:hypothetical protein [Deltaproteobacteria bacterium]
MYDDDKPSWSEIDKRKDRGGSSTGSTRSAQNKASQRSTDLAKQQLDALFTPKKDPQAGKDLKELSTLKGTAFEKQAQSYVEKHGFPTQPQDLLCFLDHEDPAFLLSLLQHIEHQYEQWSANGKGIIAGQLGIMQMMIDDPTCLDTIARLVEKLS